MGALGEVRGAQAVAGLLSAARARGARLAIIDGLAGATWSPGGRPRAVVTFTLANGKITAINQFANPDLLRAFDVTILDD
jgi:RNA polymerase sigma-70 factor (ECF subfamily)